MSKWVISYLYNNYNLQLQDLSFYFVFHFELLVLLLHHQLLLMMMTESSFDHKNTHRSPFPIRGSLCKSGGSFHQGRLMIFLQVDEWKEHRMGSSCQLSFAIGWSSIYPYFLLRLRLHHLMMMKYLWKIQLCSGPTISWRTCRQRRSFSESLSSLFSSPVSTRFPFSYHPSVLRFAATPVSFGAGWSEEVKKITAPQREIHEAIR